MSPHITIHFEFGFTLGGKTPKTVRVGKAAQRDPEVPPPVPRKDTIKRRSGHTYAHTHAHTHRLRPQQHVQQPPYLQLPQLSRSQPNLSSLPQQQQSSSRPHVTVTIPNSTAIPRHGNHHQPHAQPHLQPHSHSHPHRSRRHYPHQSRQHDNRLSRGRSAPPDTYPVGNWVSDATTRPAEHAVPAGPRQQTPLDEIPVMRFRLGDPDMPWTPRPEFGEDEGNESDDEFFATRRVSTVRTTPTRPENELRLISRHSAPMVLTADNLLTDGDREPPSRHLAALQEAMMTVDGGFGFSDTSSERQQSENRASLALDLANVPSTALSQDLATSLAMWNQDDRVIMGTARERAIAHTNSQNSQNSKARESRSSSSYTPAIEAWSPGRSVGWTFPGSSNDADVPRENAALGLVSPVSSEGFGTMDMPRRHSSSTTFSSAA